MAKIKTFIEIEGKSKEEVEKGLKMLDLTGQDVGDYDVAKLYQEIGIDMNSYSELSF